MVKVTAQDFFGFFGLCNSLLIGLGQDQQQHLCILWESTIGGSVTVAASVDDM